MKLADHANDADDKRAWIDLQIPPDEGEPAPKWDDCFVLHKVVG